MRDAAAHSAELVHRVVDFLGSNPFFVSSLPTNRAGTHVGLTWTQICVISGLVEDGLKIQGRVDRYTRDGFQIELEDAGIGVMKVQWSGKKRGNWLWGVPRSMFEGDAKGDDHDEG